MEVGGDYWQNMEESFDSSLREILELGDGTLSETKLLGRFNRFIR